MKTTVKCEHTRGPWKTIEPTHPNEMTSIFAPAPRGSGDQPWLVGYALREANPGQQPIDDANARLMAAGPEFLALLDRFLSLRQTKGGATYETAMSDLEGRTKSLLDRIGVKVVL
jgi:hypothetical protein